METRFIIKGIKSFINSEIKKEKILTEKMKQHLIT